MKFYECTCTGESEPPRLTPRSWLLDTLLCRYWFIRHKRSRTLDEKRPESTNGAPSLSPATISFWGLKRQHHVSACDGNNRYQNSKCISYYTVSVVNKGRRCKLCVWLRSWVCIIPLLLATALLLLLLSTYYFATTTTKKHSNVSVIRCWKY
jgi:hypothetical protein